MKRRPAHKRFIHLWIGIGMTLSVPLYAQQDPMYSMYMWNMMAIDPGYAGSADVLNVTALTRNQWSGIPGAPVTHSLSAHAPVNKESLGAGISLVSDNIGRTGTNSVFGDIAYRMRLNSTMRLALGMKMGFNHAHMANTRVENTDPNDPRFSTDQSGKLLPNYGFGAYLWSQRAYFGASIPKLRGNYLGHVEGESGDMYFAQERPHVFITGGYVFTRGLVKFKPAFMVRMTEGAPITSDLSANFLIQDRLWLGAAYRNGDSMTGILSIQLNDQFRAGYAYDFGLSALGNRSRGSHEVMFSYDPVFNRDRMRSPRYF